MPTGSWAQLGSTGARTETSPNQGALRTMARIPATPASLALLAVRLGLIGTSKAFS